MKTPPPLPPLPPEEERTPITQTLKRRPFHPLTPPPPPPPRDRDPGETEEIKVGLWEVDQRIAMAVDRVEKKLAADVDRRAIEEAANKAEDAADRVERAVKTSHRRWMTLLILLALYGGALAMLGAFSAENRARVERVERLTDERNLHPEAPTTPAP